MKLIRFLYKNEDLYGLLDGDKILVLPSLFDWLPRNVEDLINTGINAILELERTINDVPVREKEKYLISINEVQLLAPILNPPKIICLGLNYRDHAAEQGARIPDEPIIFMKPRTSIVGPNQPIVKPKFVKKLDYEGELAVIIGRRGKYIPVSKARDYIFGYTVFNDVSARDIQFKDRQWTRGKSFDTFAPMGPYIVVRDQVRNPENLRIRTWVNGELRQDSSTSNMVFNVYEIIHHLSKVMTLEPCDIIATGTPAGVGVFMKPEPKFLEPGDIVEIEISEIGRLKNEVTAEI
ncbi:MAG: FAA hydrolase family protein [Thermoproteota archaeon]|nr:MAG: FAA hydrolase family protein [Candidatus Korarchaeota archaeon]